MKKTYVLINDEDAMYSKVPSNFRTFESPEEFLRMMDVLKKFPVHMFNGYNADPDYLGMVNCLPLPSKYTLYEVNLSDDEEYVIEHYVNDYGTFEILKVRKKANIESTIVEVLTTVDEETNEEDND